MKDEGAEELKGVEKEEERDKGGGTKPNSNRIELDL